jgi:hypothetical protein
MKSYPMWNEKLIAMEMSVSFNIGGAKSSLLLRETSRIIPPRFSLSLITSKLFTCSQKLVRKLIDW